MIKFDIKDANYIAIIFCLCIALTAMQIDKNKIIDNQENNCYNLLKEIADFDGTL